jgi:hypothetical protein
MFCGNCGSEIQDGLEICSKCGKSPKGVVAKVEDKKMANYPLINLSSRLFYPIYEMSLWLFLIIGTVTGGVAGYYLGNAGGFAFLGVIIGFLIAFLGNIIFAGLTSIFLKMNENIEKLEKK